MIMSKCTRSQYRRSSTDRSCADTLQLRLPVHYQASIRASRSPHTRSSCRVHRRAGGMRVFDGTHDPMARCRIYVESFMRVDIHSALGLATYVHARVLVNDSMIQYA